MKIILSPAKKMITDLDSLPHKNLPKFLMEAEQLLEYLKKLDYEEIKKIWACNDKIATMNFDQLKSMSLMGNLTPAIFSYDGIQYKYIASNTFETQQLNYIEKHLRILSGMYGILRPFDGIVPYRLEMQARVEIGDKHTLYDFWEDKIATQIYSESDIIINLASTEYSKCITPFLPKYFKFITCVFGELINGKVIEKGTHCKMARGEMIRFMSENNINTVDGLKNFNRLNYIYYHELSNKNTFVFIKDKKLVL